MRHRIFIAINLPEKLKKKLAEYQNRWSDLPAKWTKDYNIHITLAFLGYVATEELPDVCKSVEEIISLHNVFEINLSKISYDRTPPKMIWAIGEKTKELDLLKKDLDSKLETSEGREFTLHITLARIRKWDWQKIEPEERPEINEDINMNFNVDSIEIVESVLKKRGPEYTILESYKLKV